MTSCEQEKNLPHFKLVINVDTGMIGVEYILSDSFLYIVEHVGPNMSTRTPIQLRYDISWSDSLDLISKLDIKFHDCQEQHALVVSGISFTNDSGTVDVDPNINHPKALDYAIRLINSMVPAGYELNFIDMQSAIEPNGKLQL